MRDFFKDCLMKLKVWTGLNQFQNLSDDEVVELLDALEITCNQYPIIPEEKKKEIILRMLRTDEKFIGFNCAIVHKWFQNDLTLHGHMYAQTFENEELKRKQEKNEAFYKKQLELKKANDPNYDPKKEYERQRVLKNI